MKDGDLGTEKSMHEPGPSSLVPSVASDAKSTEKWRIFARDPVMLFLFATFAIIANLFYTTDFRNTLENLFYDIRTNWMPPSSHSSNVIVIAIDDVSINTLEKDPLRIRTDSKKRPYLSTDVMTRIASILANTDAKAIALLMPEHAFPASDLGMSELAQIIKYDHRMIMGTNGYNQLSPNLSRLPPVLEQIDDQVTGYETFRSRSNAVVRTLPFTSYRGLSESETLPVKIAEIADPTFTAEYGFYTIKYRPTDFTPSISLAEFLNAPKHWMEKLSGKVVVVGYTVPRDAGFQTTEQMMANTPLTGQSPTIENGISTTWLTANAIDNLLNRETLKQASGAVTLIQTIIVALLCGFAWELGSLTASITTILIWGVLITIHSLIYGWISYSIPLADTFLATVLVSIFAAIRTLKTELMAMAGKEVSTEVKAEIASIQSHFLAGFASWLKDMTEMIVGLIRTSSSTTNPDSTSRDLYQRAFAAGEDFGEYLEAIRQIPEMESLSSKDLAKENLDLEDFIKKILRRFDIKLQARSISVKINIDEKSRTLRANPQLLDAIIFNFISNAIKYGPDNSPIVIQCTKAANRETIIAVIDRGPGIPNDLRERIFERFYRITDDRMYKSKGTGLGLYLCKYFAERIGGRVEVLSEVGVGSEFRVVLP
jgi:signal transduction histidine kinase